MLLMKSKQGENEMKIQTLTPEARKICMKARAKQKDHFHNDTFVDDYLAFCKATNYQDTSAENFMVYTKIYGADSKYKDHQFQSASRDGGRMYSHNRMIKQGDSEKTMENFIEDHRVQMMRRMHNAKRG